jgi:ABC-2 type transport system ATP-binding protein
VSRDDLLDLLRSLCEQDGVSILFSTHITSDLDACADDVTYLQNGTVAQSVSLAGFTAPWKKLTGPETALAPALRGALRGLRVHRGEFEALYPSDLPCPAGCREELADLQTVMVYLEREVETV